MFVCVRYNRWGIGGVLAGGLFGMIFMVGTKQFLDKYDGLHAYNISSTNGESANASANIRVVAYRMME